MKISQKLDSFIHAMLGDLESTGKAWARVGVVVMLCAAVMSFKFGASVSLAHASFLALLTFVAAFGPEAAYTAFKRNKAVAGTAIAICCAPVLTAEFYSHSAYTAGLRGSNVEMARVQNTRYDGAQDAAKEDAANLTIFKKQLATLTEQNAWAGTVKAEGLRAQLEAAQKAIDLEAARGGCKAKCLLEMEKKGKLEKDIAVAEQAADLAKRIEATQRILDGKRTVAATTEFQSSAVAHQDASLAKWVSLIGFGSIKPTEMVEETSHESANFLMALMGTGLPALSIFIAGLYRRQESAETLFKSATAGANRMVSNLTKPAGAGNTTNHIHLDDVFGKMQTALMADRHGRAA